MPEILKRLTLETALPQSVLERVISNAPRRYREFEIPKKSGGKRLIAQPSRILKTIQRALVDTLLKDMPVHDCAKAYKLNSTIRDNAIVHAGSRPILKLDFADFFPSIRSEDWKAYCEKNGLLDAEDIEISSNILFRRLKYGTLLRLAIGAPSSPILSNILMYDFDVRLTELLEPHKISYSRYADDMTFSAPRVGHLYSVEKMVRRALREVNAPNLKINKEKTNIITPKYHRMVTGLTLANDGRVTIGRKRKRLISASVHHFSLGKLDSDEIEKLSGYLAFIKSAEPDFLEVLKKKYGEDIITRLFSITPRRKYSDDFPPF